MLAVIPDLMADLDSDTRNVILTLARVWATLATGEILPKDAAAEWVMARLPAGHEPVLARARAIYLGDAPEQWDDLQPLVALFVEHVVRAIHGVAEDAHQRLARNA